MAYRWGWRPYVPVAQRRARALVQLEKLRKKGTDLQPIRLEGRKIADTFWGKAWCTHLEKFSDYANRLPRGRTYVRNGSVCHLEIAKGKIRAKVSGSALYDVEIDITSLPHSKWSEVKSSCAGQVASLLELLQGRLSEHVMAKVTDKEQGLFPLPKEIRLECSCPDWASMCKHVAAVLYGVGARLDEKPELLFLLRGVDHTELVSRESARQIVGRAPSKGRRRLGDGALAEVFGIDVAPAATAENEDGSRAARGAKRRPAARPARTAPTQKAAARKTKS